MRPLAPVDTIPLFRPLLAELLGLLRGLSPDDWERRTVAGSWRVADVATHLLDGDLRRLSATRDGHALTRGLAISDTRDVLALVNGLNATGVAWGARLSRGLLVDLLAVSGEWIVTHFGTLPPHGRAAFSVAWAGEDASENWMDVGREYTERWHHQMQIREAVGARGLLEERWLTPVLELSLRALPRAYAAVEAPEGTAVEFAVYGRPEGTWTVARNGGAWVLGAGADERAAARVVALPEHAWKLFFNALPRDRALAALEISGDPRLVDPLLRARAVMV